jgi:hypothetical protein
MPACRSGGFGAAGDIVGGSTSQPNPLDPSLNPLGPTGGPTETCSLQPDSPAIGKAKSLANVTTDQRGEPRGVEPDIGAFQLISRPSSGAGLHFGQ